mmetsp:Transcript_16969/g.31724  ORF Transcript_16969/g.31724 Transcript_16969/m.31724 type:complete len:441 (-) Transcript_16969:159-1481(-)
MESLSRDLVLPKSRLTTMESLPDDLVLQMSRFIKDPVDLVHFAMTCRRAYQLCCPMPLILSNGIHTLRRQPIFLASAAGDASHTMLLTRQSYRASLTTRGSRQQWGPLYMLVHDPQSGQRAYLGRFQRSRVFLQDIDTPRYRSEVHYGLAFKTGEPEEQWTINVVGCTTSHRDDCLETTLEGILATLHCHGTEKDCRGWTKARDLTGNVSAKRLQIDALGKFFSPRNVTKHTDDEPLFCLTPMSSLVEEDSLEALPIPIVPKPLFSFAGKITVFEPSTCSLNGFWIQIPPPSSTQIAMEFDVMLHDGIYTLHARGMTFGVSIPVLMEDALTTWEDYYYFLLHLFRRNSGRWETLQTYFAYSARALLLQSSAAAEDAPFLLLPPPPRLEDAVSSWPTEHRDHSYQIRDQHLYIHVRDGVPDTRAPTILPSPEPWRLFLCDV